MHVDPQNMRANEKKRETEEEPWVPGTMGGALGGKLEWLSGKAVEASAMGLEMPVSFALLAHDDIFICDTGASSHATRIARKEQRTSE